MAITDQMIRLLTAGARIALVAVAMTVTVPMITFPQTSQTTTEGEPAAAEAAVANASPTSDENSTDNDTSVKTGPPAKSPIPVAVENELRRELLDVIDGYSKTVPRASLSTFLRRRWRRRVDPA